MGFLTIGAWRFNPFTGKQDYYESGTNATTLHDLTLEIPDAADDGKYIQYEHTGTLYQMTTPPGGGDMLEAVWDSGTDGFIDADAGGTDIDTSAATGVPSISAGTWSVGATLTHELGGLEDDVSAYSGLLGIAGGTTGVINSAALLETYAGLGAFANEYLDDPNAAAMLVTLGLSATAAEINTPLDGASVVLAEFQQLETIGATTISANQWAALGSIAETLTGAELTILDGVTSTTAQLNFLNGAAGTTGTTSTNLVFNTSPTLITPVLGAATGTSLATTGDLTSSSGDLITGTDDTTAGNIVAYGAGGSGAGAYIDLYNSADDDAAGTQDFWRIRAAGTNLQIGIEGALTTSSAFILNADGSINKGPTPKIVLDDTDGADGYIDLNAVNADDAVITLGVDASPGDVPADDIPYIELDGSNDRVEVKVALDAGDLIEILSSNTDFTSTEATTARKTFYMSANSDANVEVSLQASGITAGGASRVLTFFNGENGNFDFIITPNGTDAIRLGGIGTCGSGNPVYCGENAILTIRGIANIPPDIWVGSFVGACACSTQQ